MPRSHARSLRAHMQGKLATCACVFMKVRRVLCNTMKPSQRKRSEPRRHPHYRYLGLCLVLEASSFGL